MMLAFNARLSTKDVDAIFEPPEMIRTWAREIAEEANLPADWLNDGVKGFVSDAPQYTREGLPQMSNLRLIRPTAEYLLAMKCVASRFPSYSEKGDLEDILFLINHLALKEPEDVFRVIEKFYPVDRILPKTRFLILELLAKATQSSNPDPSAPIEPPQ